LKSTTCTNNYAETLALGEALGIKLVPGDVVALFGDLGAGKTVLTKGIASGLEFPDEIHSPTFTLIHEHLGASEAEVESIGVEEYIHGDGVTVIEWADRMKSMLPPDRLDVYIKITGEDTREFVFETDSGRLAAVIEEVTGHAADSD
jgi:tRNA threonylcarbamoyladenosine biosynthesis protein TsaE